MSGLEYLCRLKETHRASRIPSVPHHAVPRVRYNDKNANDLTKCIVDFLHLSGCQAERISVEGRTIDTRKRYVDAIGRVRMIGNVKRIRSSAKVGSADISAIIDGRSVKIEVKIGKDRQSAKQREYQKSVESAGGVYLIIRSFQEFYDWYQMAKG